MSICMYIFTRTSAPQSWSSVINNDTIEFFAAQVAARETSSSCKIQSPLKAETLPDNGNTITCGNGSKPWYPG